MQSNEAKSGVPIEVQVRLLLDDCGATVARSPRIKVYYPGANRMIEPFGPRPGTRVQARGIHSVATLVLVLVQITVIPVPGLPIPKTYERDTAALKWRY